MTFLLAVSSPLTQTQMEGLVFGFLGLFVLALIAGLIFGSK